MLFQAANSMSYSELTISGVISWLPENYRFFQISRFLGFWELWTLGVEYNSSVDYLRVLTLENVLWIHTGPPLKLYSGIYSNYFRKWFLELGKVTRFRLATMYQIECNTLHQTPFFVYSISHIKSPLIGCLICIRIGSVMDAVRAASMSYPCAVMGSWTFFCNFLVEQSY